MEFRKKKSNPSLCKYWIKFNSQISFLADKEYEAYSFPYICFVFITYSHIINIILRFKWAKFIKQRTKQATCSIQHNDISDWCYRQSDTSNCKICLNAKMKNAMKWSKKKKKWLLQMIHAKSHGFTFIQCYLNPCLRFTQMCPFDCFDKSKKKVMYSNMTHIYGMYSLVLRSHFSDNWIDKISNIRNNQITANIDMENGDNHNDTNVKQFSWYTININIAPLFIILIPFGRQRFPRGFYVLDCGENRRDADFKYS